jgi:hypothetical protein
MIDRQRINVVLRFTVEDMFKTDSNLDGFPEYIVTYLDEFQPVEKG